MDAVATLPAKRGRNERLEDLFQPCPVCGGTTELDGQAMELFCESCDMRWDL